MKLLIINGPNLNLLGKREPDIYGNIPFEQFLDDLRDEFRNIQIDYYQSNHEGDLVDKIQEAEQKYRGIILNAAAYTHTSVAIADAVAAINTPVIEVHISNIYQREKFRHHSFLSPNCVGSIVGFGLESYRLAIMAFTDNSENVAIA